MSGADLARGVAYTIKGSPAPYLVPPAAALVNLGLSGVLTLMWGEGAGPSVWQTACRAGLVVALSLAVIVVTWLAGRARHLTLRAASILMSTGACGGLFVLAFHGWTFDLVAGYLLVMITASGMLAVIKVMGGDGTDARPKVFGELHERVRELQDIGKTSRPKVVDGRVVTETVMMPGGDFGALAKPDVRTALASALDVPVTGVRMVPDRTSPRRGRMEFSPADMLETPPPWPGLSNPGGSIASGLRVAVYQTGKQLPLYPAGDAAAGRNAIGAMVVLGQSGSGKTWLQLTIAAEARSRHDTEVIYIDGRKGMQLPAALRESVHVFIADADDGEAYLMAQVDDVAARAARMGEHGHNQWTGDCERCPPFRLVIVDEASKFVEAEETLVELAESVRSVGICLLLGIQRATGDRLPTSVRSTIGGVICLGVSSAKEGARVLSAETIEAGADPGWKNAKPGALYAELPGTDPDDWSLPARTYRPDEQGVLGELLTHLASEGQRVAVRPAAVPARASEPEPAEDDPDCPPMPVDPECDPSQVDPREPITVPDRPRIPLTLEPQGGRRYDPDQVRAMFRDLIMNAHAAGIKRLKPSMFSPIAEIVGDEGLKPPTVTKILRELCEPGPGRLLRRSEAKGVYLIDPERTPQLAGAAT